MNAIGNIIELDMPYLSSWLSQNHIASCSPVMQSLLLKVALKNFKEEMFLSETRLQGKSLKSWIPSLVTNRDPAKSKQISYSHGLYVHLGDGGGCKHTSMQPIV